MMSGASIDGFDVKIGVGSHVRPDGWTIGQNLLPGDSFSTYRIATPNGGPITSLAVEVEIVGRTVQWKYGSQYVRVKITFPGDGEPDTVTRGWLTLK